LLWFAISVLSKLVLLTVCTFLAARYLSRQRRFLRRAALAETCLVVVAASVLTVRMTDPLAHRMADRLPWSDLDGYYVAYVEAWDVHALLTRPSHLFDANFFFPAKDTLALSENHLGQLPIFAPVYALTGNSILASNIVLLATFFLSAIAMYLLVRLWLGDCWAAALAGFVYAFAPVRIHQMPRVHVISVQFIPVIVLFFLRFLKSGQVSYLVAFTGLTFFQILTSLHAGVFASFVVLAFFLAEFLERPWFLTRRVVIGLLASSMVLGTAVLPLAMPYLKWERKGILSDETAPAEELSATLSSYLNGDSALYPGLLKRFRAPLVNYEKILFFGFLPLAMCLVGIADRFRRKRYSGAAFESQRDKNDLAMGSIITILFGFVLSLGPYFHLGSIQMRLPYYWFSRFVPGFHAVRNPCRFGLVVLFGVAILSGLGFHKVLEAVRRSWPLDSASFCAALAVALLFVVYWEFQVSVGTQPAVTEVSREYRFLSRQAPGSVTLELPTMSWSAPASNSMFTRESWYVYASSFDWQPLMNGFSGHVPNVSYKISALAVKLPSADAVSALANYGLRFVVVHPGAMSAAEIAAWQTLPQTSRLKEVARFTDAVVYRLQSAEAAK
jgi:hypothetical protein